MKTKAAKVSGTLQPDVPVSDAEARFRAAASNALAGHRVISLRQAQELIRGYGQRKTARRSRKPQTRQAK
jgi:hypothetical protein